MAPALLQPWLWGGSPWRLAAVTLALCGSAGASAQGVSPEYQLKAAFVSKFPEFTEWPPHALNARKTIDICVARPSPFGGTLSEFAAAEVIGGRPLQVREIAGPTDVPSCLVLFIPARSAGAQRDLLASAQKAPVLTVGESTAFIDQGGIINLRMVDGRVRFDVNVGAANRAGVRLSSQLLRLALTVRSQAP
jgi:hypothetical protein